MEDAFNYGLPVYTFQNICKESKEITMEDGTTKIFYNASKYDIMPTEQLKNFFSFLNGKDEKTPLTDKLNAMVKRAKLNVHWRRKFMNWEQELQIREKQSFAEGKEQGVQQGINTSKLSIAKTMLKKQFSINDIVECTGLTEEQIKELK